MDAVQQVQMRVKLRQLEQEHADMDAAISALEHSGTSDQLQLRRLKKIKTRTEGPDHFDRELAHTRYYCLRDRYDRTCCYYYGKPVRLGHDETRR
jgi:hypothetical protein